MQWSGPLPRKRFATLLVLVVVLLAFVSACASPASTPAPAESAPTAVTTDDSGEATTDDTTTEPADDGSAEVPSGDVKDVTVTLPYLADGITSFDHAYWTSQLLVSQGTIYEGLYGYDQELNVVPKVAESATPNEDYTVWTFKLRQDKKWSNGDPVTANDYYASWVRFIGSDLPDAPMWAGFHGYVKNGWAFKGGAVPVEELGIKLIDDYTIEVSLIQPVPALPSFMVLSSAMPIHAKTLADHSTDWWDPQFAVYNGPYTVSNWVSGGDTTLTRNANYVGEGIGNVKTIVLRPYADANARLQGFENGEIQFSFLEDASQVAYGQNNPLFSENIHEEASLNWEGIQYDKAANDGPFADIRVRQAFAMVIDKQAIATSILRDLAVPTTAFSGDPDVSGAVTPLPYDVAAAQKLMEEAGFPGGAGFPEVTFYAPAANAPDMPVIEAVAKMWRDNLGVTVTIQNMEQGPYDTLRWGKIDTDTLPGYTTLSGPLNWFEPGSLLEGSDQIWYYMDFKPEWKPEMAELDRQQLDAPNLTEAGDFADLEARATDVWARRQVIIEEQKGTDWGNLMETPPSFWDNFTEVKARYDEAATDEDKLSAYKDALLAIIREELDVGMYENMNPSNREATGKIITLRQSTMEDATQLVIDINQLAVDSAWMVPIYVKKLVYVTDPHVSGIVLNKLAWGHIFQFQYLTWTD